MSGLGRARRRILGALPSREQTFLAEALREETVGGALLLAAATVAVTWASSPWWGVYESIRTTVVGPASLHLDLDLATWASDGLLAVFFFVAGLELKRELVAGQLRRPAEAVLPMVAALCGMVVPAAVYLVATLGDASAAEGWAVPMATDIAFALAVLAVLGSALPTSLRAFLLTLAVVDDLGAILVIAIGFTDDLDLAPLAAAGGLLAAYLLLQRARWTPWVVTVPLGVVVWVLVHESGVHATVAGIALGLATRARPDPAEEHSPAERLEHVVRPLSAGIAVPAFAFLAAGVRIDADSVAAAVDDRAATAVVLALVVGKFVGVFGGTWLTARLTRAELSDDLAWSDIAAVALLSGIGFTVSLLITELTFPGEDRADHVTAAVLAASVLAAALAGVVLRLRTRTHRARVTGP